MKYSTLTFLFCAIVASCAVAQLPPTLHRISEYDSAVDGIPAFYTVPCSAELKERGVTLEMRAKIDSKSRFNIFLAFQPKSDPQHWEFYTMAGSGQVALYVPGNSVPNVVGGPDLNDGTEHTLRAEIRESEIEIWVDGASVARAPYDRPVQAGPESPTFAVGSLVEGTIRCDGNLRDIRVSREGKTLFESAEMPILKGVPDESQLYPRGGVEIEVKPGEHPARNIPVKTCTENDLRVVLEELGVTSVSASDFRPGVLENWGAHFCDLQRYLTGKTELGTTIPPRGATEQVYDRHALILPGETHPAQIVCRRTFALLEELELQNEPRLAGIRADLETCRRAIETEPRDGYFFAVCALRRKLMFLKPELATVDKILFCARGSYAGSRLTGWYNSDRIGGHFATQVYGFNTIHGGGLFTISGWKEKTPEIQNVLEGRTISPKSRETRLAGRALDYGAFMSPELGYDGKTLYFAHSGSREHCWKWTPDTTWNLFKLDLNDGLLEQLTDSAYNDFDPCELPGGRVVFVSERRGGFIRCFGESAQLRVTTAVLHSMKPDGSDIYSISFFETSEWQPSVDNRGMLVYTRWDYTDRENCLGSAFWTCFPDGRNPRAPHGNYPQPWHTFSDNSFGDTRFGQTAPSALPMTEMQIRAIPGSHKYVFLAAPHHGETYGSVCILDLREEDDNHMNQIRRVTPYVPFPESEAPGRSQYRYGAPWPLNANTFLCNSWEDLVVLDRYGNEELICERELLPIGYDPRLRLSDPIPVQPRSKPQEIMQQTVQGTDFSDVPESERKATVGVVNVHITDQPLPSERPIRFLRIFQVIPKPNPWMNTPDIGFAPENTPRVPIGVVPVESDGSAFFEVPYGKQLLFQILDENYQAVQTMRAVTYAHPGEKLLCVGCHEPVQESVAHTLTQPLAFRRAPSKPEIECEFDEPINFYRLIKPEIERSCIPCHEQRMLPFQRMGYEDFRPYVFYFAGGMRGAVTRPEFGGSRSIPGRCGAGGSKLSEILMNDDHRETVTDDVRHRFTLWLDANAPRLGAFRDEKAQMEGELVRPILD